MRKSMRRGFSLTETAIVLGIMGLIISGLWAIVASAREHARVEQTAGQVLIMVRGVQSFFQSQIGVKGNTSQLTSCMVAQKLVPSEMIMKGSTDTACCSGAGTCTAELAHSWSSVSGGGVKLSNLSKSNSTDDQQFIVEFINLPEAGCIKLVLRLTGDGVLPGFSDVKSKVGSDDTSLMNADISTIKSACASGVNTIDFIYRLRPPQQQ